MIKLAAASPAALAVAGAGRAQGIPLETEMPAEEENFAGLVRINRELNPEREGVVTG